MVTDFDRLKGKMRERGISRQEVKNWLEEEYAPLSDDLKLGMLTPTMCDNLVREIEEGELEG